MCYPFKYITLHSFVLAIHYIVPLQATFLSAIHLFQEIYVWKYRSTREGYKISLQKKNVFFHSNEQKASCIIIKKKKKTKTNQSYALILLKTLEIRCDTFPQ